MIQRLWWALVIRPIKRRRWRKVMKRLDWSVEAVVKDQLDAAKGVIRSVALGVLVWAIIIAAIVFG